MNRVSPSVSVYPCVCPRTNRPQGLYRGLDTKLAQTVLMAALVFTSKEQLAVR